MAPKSSKKQTIKKLRKTDIKLITKKLGHLDNTIIVERVAKIETAQFIRQFEDRSRLWNHLATGAGQPLLLELITLGLSSFCSLYEQHSKGSERHAKLLVDWSKESAKYATDVSSTTKSREWLEKVRQSYGAPI